MPVNAGGSKKNTLARIIVMVVSIVVAAVTVAVMLIFSVVYNRELHRNAKVSSEQTVAQVEATVYNYLSGMKDSLDIICGALADSVDTAAAERVASVAAELRTDVAAIMVYDLEGRLLSYGAPPGEPTPVLKEDLSRNLSFDGALFASAAEYAVTTPHVQNLFAETYPWVVTIARRETLAVFGGEVYVAMDFSFSSIASYVDNVGIGQHGYCYIADAQGNIVYHPQQQMIFAGIKQEDTASVAGCEDGVYSDDDVIRAVMSLPDSTWRVVGVSYTDDLVSSAAKTTRLVFLMAAAVCIVMAIAISVLFSRVVTRPVRSLAEAMRSFEENPENFRYQPEKRNIYELQMLSGSFSHMVRMVQQLMERVRREEITLRKTELKALQAQINPHFLYNTLDSIQWMCERDKSRDAVEMVGALARLFRISISRGKELIPVREELRHAQSYLVIQTRRYQDQFDYEFRVDESIADCLCNKITIQPLVENAIYHGLDRMVDKGHIVITAASDGGDVVLSVSDNGVGMTAEQSESILKKDRTDSSGIGIKNVNDRVKIYFGESYGVTIDSEPDVGTTIFVRFPQTRKEPENEV